MIHARLPHHFKPQQGAVVGSVVLHVLLACWFLSAPLSVQMLPQQMVEVTLVPASMLDAVVRHTPNTQPEQKTTAPAKPAAVKKVQPVPSKDALPERAKQPDQMPVEPSAQELAEISPAAAPPAARSPQSAAVTKPLFDAAYLRNPAPDYPSQAKRRGMEGVVMLDVLVKQDGVAAEVSVAQSSGYSMLDESARNAVQRWKFVPAKQGAQTVDARVMVPIEFKLQ